MHSWQILWTFEKYLDTAVNYQRYNYQWYHSPINSSIDENNKKKKNVPQMHIKHIDLRK